MKTSFPWSKIVESQVVTSVDDLLGRSDHAEERLERESARRNASAEASDKHLCLLAKTLPYDVISVRRGFLCVASEVICEVKVATRLA